MPANLRGRDSRATLVEESQPRVPRSESEQLELVDRLDDGLSFGEWVPSLPLVPALLALALEIGMAVAVLGGGGPLA